MDDHEERIRRFAYHIWLEEGRPHGRATIHWEMARELVAIQDSQKAATQPVRRNPNDSAIAADAVESAGPAASAGELPTMTNAGEQTYPPAMPAAKQAAEQVSSVGNKAAKPKTASTRSTRPRTKK